jgi:hypothetical protein
MSKRGALPEIRQLTAEALIFPEFELQAPEGRWELQPDIGAKSHEGFL